MHIKNNYHNKSSIGDLLLLLRRNIMEKIKQEGFKDDLTFSQVEVLRFVGPGGRSTMRSIAEYMKITPPSATELVAEMEKKGLIKRKSDQKDRRVVYIVLSGSAEKLFSTLTKQKDAIFKKMVAKLNEKDKKNLERIIKIITQ